MTVARVLPLALGAAWAAALPLVAQAPIASRVIEDFENVEDWKALPSDGVGLTIATDSGRTGPAMRLDFDFRGRSGYAIARRAIALDLPENYEFSFWIRGDARPNTLEFKLVDSTGDNVWWHTRPRFEFTGEWRRLTIKKRHIAFAWGPAGGGELGRAATLELVVTAAQGGAGTVWIDELAFTPREAERPYDLTPRVTASSALPGTGPGAVVDTGRTRGWRSAPGRQWLALDFLRLREFSGLVIDWAPGLHATEYAVETSPDSLEWSQLYLVRGGDGGRDHLYLPESESRFLRLRLVKSAGGGGYRLRRLRVQPPEWADSPTAFLQRVAENAPRGSFPRYLAGEQSYWTVIGASGDGRRGLLNEDGALELGSGGPALEPFLQVRGRLITWNDARPRVWLERGDLPIPSVEWRAGTLGLTVTAFAAGSAGASSLIARYRVVNRSAAAVAATLYLALRPLQVNPPWQFLGTPGGAAPVRRIGYAGRTVMADSHVVVAVTPPAGFGATDLDRGDIVEHLRRGLLPRAATLEDSAGRASGALAYPLELAPGASHEIFVEIPLYSDGAAVPRPATARDASTYGDGRLAETTRWWADRLDRVGLRLPPSQRDLAQTIRANVAYILINCDGPAIEPGARSYRRSWIRDGAMISAALLRLGQREEVEAFLDWYRRYQYPDGKVPCCVDARGADPVPEHDSHGQLIYLAMEYYRHTRDRAVLERAWPNVERAVAYIDSLRHSRMGAAYETADSIAFRGLLPQSISHEGYSAKPMHSYWDDFFALKGLKDAADMAEVLGRDAERERIAAIRDQFRRDLYASIGRAMARHGIGYIPGSVELGDFDATSTTVALAPAGEAAHLPGPALNHTLERYWNEFQARRAGSKPWEAYTPYELRTVGTMLRLGWKARAHAALAGFLEHRRPAGWRHWAEVVWRDPAAARFIGDMPHTWVGSDFLRSVLDFFAYEREADTALVVGDGVREGWVMEPPGVAVHGLSTHYGPLSYSMRGNGDTITVRIEDGVNVPSGGVIVRNPRGRPVRRATVNGTGLETSGDVVVRQLPAEIILWY